MFVPAGLVGDYSRHEHGDGFLCVGDFTAVESVTRQVGQAWAVGGTDSFTLEAASWSFPHVGAGFAAPDDPVAVVELATVDDYLGVAVLVAVVDGCGGWGWLVFGVDARCCAAPSFGWAGGRGLGEVFCADAG